MGLAAGSVGFVGIGGAVAVPALPVPLSVLGSVIDLTGMTPAERAVAAESIGKAWAATGGGVPPVAGAPARGVSLLRTPLSALGKGVGATNPMTAGVTGFVVAFEGTSQIIKLTGLAPGSDVGTDGLFKILTQNGWLPVKAAEFIANQDADSPTPPGWKDGVNMLHGGETTGQGAGNAPYWDNLSISADVVSAPDFMAPWSVTPGHDVIVYISIGGTASTTVGNNPGSSAHISAKWIDPANPAGMRLTMCGGYPSPAQGSGLQGKLTPLAGSTTYNCRGNFGWPYNNWVFDSVVIDAYPSVFPEQDGSVPASAELTWFPVGHVGWTPGTDGDPSRVWETRWNCSDGSTDSVRSASFTEAGGDWPEFPSASCGAGLYATLVQVWEVAPDGSVEDVLMDEWESEEGLTDWVKKYPQCLDGSCKLLLSRIDHETGGRLDCFGNPSACVNWLTDPARADNYECTYAGGVVALSECFPYGPTFNVGTGTSVDVDGKPMPADDVLPLGDPATGAAIPKADAAGEPGAEPATGEPSAGCPPPFSFTAGGMGYWVSKGVSCALEAAFVPVTSPAKIANIGATIQTKTPFPQISSLAAPMAGPQGGTLCLKLSIPLKFVLGHDQPFLDTCNGSDPVSRLLLDNRTLLGAAVWVTVIAPFLWWAWKQYAPGATGVA